jgi:phosphoadenosine phosphosulfate reductase
MPCELSKEERLQRLLKLKLIFKNFELHQIENEADNVNDEIFWRFKVDQATHIIKKAAGIFNNNLVVAFSGGKDSLVALHLTLRVLGNQVSVIYNHTTVEFPETLKYVKQLADEWNLNLIVTRPTKSFFSAVKEKGWATHKNRWCCKPYKDEPAHNFMKQKGIMTEITGTTRTESLYRRSLKPFSFPKREPYIIRIHPLYDWNQWEIWKYIKENKLPYNPLYDMGYQRIGCWCCPINGLSHYRRLKRTHPKLFEFLCNFTPIHPNIAKLQNL